MNRLEAIEKLKQENYKVAPDQDFEVRRMEPEDAWGVARCFFSVYGPHYPFEVYYIPERLIEENRCGNVHSVVARTQSGDVIGYGALYRSSAHSPKVFEWGQGIVLPEYRSTLAIYCIQDYVLHDVAASEDVDEVFGEAVCNHVLTQRLSAIAGFRETGIEVGLLPAEAYPNEAFPHDRISTVLGFKSFSDRMQVIHLPVHYASELEYILSGLDIARSVELSNATPPTGSSTGIATQFFDQPHVARFNIHHAGEDFPQVLRACEEEGQCRGMEVLQFYVNLGEPGSGWIVALLRERGYFFGGFLPRWFDTDGLLMQKLTKPPSFASIKLKSERARRILDFIRQDLEGNPACRLLLRADPESP